MGRDMEVENSTQKMELFISELLIKERNVDKESSMMRTGKSNMKVILIMTCSTALAPITTLLITNGKNN